LDERLALTIGLLVSFLTWWLSQYYVSGDQEGYRAAYSIVSGVGLWDARALYELKISGSDYFHFILVWLTGSLELNKDMVMSIANGFLAAFTWHLLIAWGAGRSISTLIALSNFYMLVLYFAAERLKFGILFLILSLLAEQSYKQRISFAILSVASHVTVLLVGWGFWVKVMIQSWSGTSRTRDRVYWMGLAFVIIISMMVFERQMLLGKLHTYIESRPYFKVWDVMPAIFMFAGAIFYSKKIGDPLLKMGPLLLMIVILGGSRLNMLLYFVFLYYALRCRAGWNAGVLLTSVYLGWKSVLFVQNIFHHGHGFPA
jgi:hypothetical protein